MNEDFIQKLMISKKIMDKHNSIPRNTNGAISESSIGAPELYSAEPINATYNLPQELLETTSPTPKPITPSQMTPERIQNSKLPDAIKKLMIEHPIKQPESYSPTISNDILEKAARLMREEKDVIQSSKQTNTSYSQPKNNNSDLKSVIRETLEEILSEHGILSESESKTKDTFQFRVGKHIFEGTVTKIKKIK